MAGEHFGKITDRFIKAVETVVSDPFLYILTIEELVNSINDEIGEKYISLDTFKSYINGRRGSNQEHYDHFIQLYKRAITKQKKSLVMELSGEDKSWQRYAWLLERKFEDFNKIEKAENENNHKGDITITRKTIK